MTNALVGIGVIVSRQSLKNTGSVSPPREARAKQ